MGEIVREFPLMRALRSWSRDVQGATAIEFALVAVPFFMFIFGTLGVGLHFFTVSTLEHAVDSAARKLRTGEAQTSGMTVGDFKQMVTEQGSGLIKPAKLNLHVQKASTWADLTPVKCLDTDRNLTAPRGGAGVPIGQYAGGPGEVVLVTACYEWDVAQVLKFIGIGNMANGSSLLQAATTFRSEPYQ